MQMSIAFYSIHSTLFNSIAFNSTNFSFDEMFVLRFYYMKVSIVGKGFRLDVVLRQTPTQFFKRKRSNGIIRKDLKGFMIP